MDEKTPCASQLLAQAPVPSIRPDSLRSPSVGSLSSTRFPVSTAALLCSRYLLAEFLPVPQTSRSNGAKAAQLLLWSLGTLPGDQYEVLGVWSNNMSESCAFNRALEDLAGRGVERLDLVRGVPEPLVMRHFSSATALEDQPEASRLCWPVRLCSTNKDGRSGARSFRVSPRTQRLLLQAHRVALLVQRQLRELMEAGEVGGTAHDHRMQVEAHVHRFLRSVLQSEANRSRQRDALGACRLGLLSRVHPHSPGTLMSRAMQ